MGEGWSGGIGSTEYRLLYIEGISNKVLLNSDIGINNKVLLNKRRELYIQYPTISQNGKDILLKT